MRIERVGEIKTLEHGVARPQQVFGAKRRFHCDTLRINRHDARLIGVEQAALVIGRGPANAVAIVDLEWANLKQTQRILLTLRSHLARPEFKALAPLALQHHAFPGGIDRDHVIAALLQPLPPLPAVDFEHHADCIAARIAHFLTRQVDARQHVEMQGTRPQFPISLEPGLDCFIHLSAQVATRCIDRGDLALGRR